MSEFCLWIDGNPEHYGITDDSMFGIKNGYRVGSDIKAVKDINGAKLFLVRCYDLYEDGYW